MKSLRAVCLAMPALLALAFTGCEIIESETQWDNPADSLGVAYKPQSSAVVAISSSVELSSSSAVSSSSQASSSSVQGTTLQCALQNGATVNANCTYDTDQYIVGSVTIGSYARLRFVDGARLLVSGSALTISDGARLSFGSGSYVYVTNNGKLDVLGTSLNPVRFAADESGVAWGISGSMLSSAGIYIDATALASEIRHADVSGATVGLYAPTPTNIKVRQCNFHDNALYGMAINSLPTNGSIDSSAFTGNGTADIWLRMDYAQALGSKLELGKGLGISGTSLDHDVTLPAYPYVVTGEIAIDNSAQLTVSAGASFLMADGAYFNVGKGRLVVSGTSDKPVVFEPLQADGFWGDLMDGKENQTAIHLNKDCLSGSRLDYVRIRRAHTALSNWCANPLEVRNSEVTDYQYYAYSGSASLFLVGGTMTVTSTVAGAQMRYE